MQRLCLSEARRWATSPADAEDIAQEALMRAWRRRAACRAIGDPEPWLRRIVRNEALRARERQGMQRQKVERAGGEVRSVEQPPDLPLRVDVRTALRGLTTEDRVLLALRYQGDLTQEHVAKLMGLPEGTVKVRLHRLRARLSTQLSYG
jgi:RNA polymerase sigma-70 factor (ECF subfamily)